MLEMFTYADILKWIPGAKPREYTYFSRDCKSEHCIQLQKYRRDLENLVKLTSSLKEVEDDERKEILDSLPPIPELPEMSDNFPKNNIIEETELSDDSIISLLSKAAAHICLLIGYTDAPPHLLEELSKIMKDYLRFLILKCSVAGGPITLEPLEKALQELGINGVKELQCYYYNRIVKFHNGLYSKCNQLRKELENNMKVPLKCPHPKHLSKRKKFKDQNVEVKEENNDDLSLESGETVEVLYIKKLMKSNNFFKEEDKKEIRIKSEENISSMDQKPYDNNFKSCVTNIGTASSDKKSCEFNSNSCLKIKKETPSNFESSKNVKNDQNLVKKEFEESDKKLLDKYAAFLTFVPMTRKCKLIDKSHTNKEQFKKELQMNIDSSKSCNSLVMTEENKCFPVPETEPIKKLANEEKTVFETFEKSSSVPNSAVSVIKYPHLSEKGNKVLNYVSDTNILNIPSVSTLEGISSHTSTDNLKIGDERDIFSKNSDTEIVNYSVTSNTCNFNSSINTCTQNLKPCLLSSRYTLKEESRGALCNQKKGNNSLKESFCEQEKFSKINITEGKIDAIEIKNDEIVFNEQNTKCKKDVSLSKTHNSCCFENAIEEKILLNTNSKDVRTLNYLHESIEIFPHCSSTKNKIQYLKPVKRNNLKLKNTVNDIKNVSKSENNCIKDFNIVNSELNKISCFQSGIKSEKDLLQNSIDIHCSKDILGNNTIINVNSNKKITSEQISGQSSDNSSEPYCHSKYQPARKRRKLKR